MSVFKLNSSFFLAVRCACVAFILAATSSLVFSQDMSLTENQNGFTGLANIATTASMPNLEKSLLNSSLQNITKDLQGIRYRFGGTSIESGLDCSGLIKLIWARLGLSSLPRKASDMAAIGENIETNDLKPGDLVFFNTLGRAYSHVGVYLGLGRFLHASSVQGKVVENSLDERYYSKRFNGARRPSRLLSELEPIYK